MTDSSRTVLVTGAASGIGRAVAEHQASRGDRVVLLDRNRSVMEVADGLGGVALVFDLASASSDDIAAGLGAATDVLDAVVCAAGVADAFRIDGDMDVYRRVLDVNLTGAIQVIRAALPALRRSAAPRVLTVGSIQGAHSGADSVAYAASKGALHSATRALAVDLSADGILVNALAPGFVETAMSALPEGRTEFETEWFERIYVEHGRIPLRRPAQPAEIAAAAEFFLSPANTYVTGAVLVADGGLTATF